MQSGGVRKKKGQGANLPSRTLTGLGTLIKGTEKRATRGALEMKGSIDEQCRRTLGKPQPHQPCWLCGYQIRGLEPYSQNINGDEKAALPACEHVLPVRLAYLLTGLRDKDTGGRGVRSSPDLLHAEYEYAHRYCNQVKSQKYFITKQGNEENWCGLEVNEDRIDEFLNDLWTSSDYFGDYEYYHRGSNVGLYFKNVVQLLSYLNGTLTYEEWQDVAYDEWFPKARDMILWKSYNLIEILQREDDCGGENEGVLWQDAMIALEGIQAPGRRQHERVRQRPGAQVQGFNTRRASGVHMYVHGPRHNNNARIGAGAGYNGSAGNTIGPGWGQGYGQGFGNGSGNGSGNGYQQFVFTNDGLVVNRGNGNGNENGKGNGSGYQNGFNNGQGEGEGQEYEHWVNGINMRRYPDGSYVDYRYGRPRVFYQGRDVTDMYGGGKRKTRKQKK